MCNGVRKATLLALERRDEVLGRGLGRSGGVQGDSAIWASGSSLRMKTAHWSRWLVVASVITNEWEVSMLRRRSIGRQALG
jgi:hypothetical protein